MGWEEEAQSRMNVLQAWVLGIAKLTDMAEYAFGILH